MFGFPFLRRRKVALDVGYLVRIATQEDEEARKRLAEQVAAALADAQTPEEERRALLPVALKLAMDAAREVRMALAQGLEKAAALDAELIYAIAGDEEEIALPFLRKALALRDVLAQMGVCKVGDAARRLAICGRRDVAPEVVEYLALRGEREVVMALLGNAEVALSPALARRLYVRFRDDKEVIARLLQREDLPLEVRLAHVEITHGRAADVLNSNEWEWLAARHAATADAEEQGYAEVLGKAQSLEELDVALAFLSRRGRLTAAVLLRAAVAGDVFVLGRALGYLAQVKPARVEKAFAQSGSLALARTLLAQAGLPASAHALALAVILAARAAGPGVLQPAHRVPQMGRRVLKAIAETEALGVAEKMQASNMLARLGDAETAQLAGRFTQTLMQHAA